MKEKSKMADKVSFEKLDDNIFVVRKFKMPAEPRAKIIRQTTAKGTWDSVMNIHQESSLSLTVPVLRKLCSLRLLLEHLNEMTAFHNQLEEMLEELKDIVSMDLILSSLPMS